MCEFLCSSGVIFVCNGGGGDSFLSFLIALSGWYATYNNSMEYYLKQVEKMMASTVHEHIDLAGSLHVCRK